MNATGERVEDWVLIHAWVEAGHPGELRIRMRRPFGQETPEERRVGFTDADEAAAFVRQWLLELARRSRERPANGSSER